STPHPIPPRSPLFPYTTLFRSRDNHVELGQRAADCVPPGEGEPAGADLLLELQGKALHEFGIYLNGVDSCATPEKGTGQDAPPRSEEHTSELQSRENLVCRLLL